MICLTWWRLALWLIWWRLLEEPCASRQRAEKDQCGTAPTAALSLRLPAYAGQGDDEDDRVCPGSTAQRGWASGRGDDLNLLLAPDMAPALDWAEGARRAEPSAPGKLDAGAQDVASIVAIVLRNAGTTRGSTTIGGGSTGMATRHP